MLVLKRVMTLQAHDVQSHNILERVVQGNSEIEQKYRGIIID